MSLSDHQAPKQTAISISLPQDLLDRIDTRARELNIPRSRYLAWLAQGDIAKGGAIAITPLPVDRRNELKTFLAYAIPALEEYVANPQAAAVPPSNVTDAEIWEIFFRERRQILDLKWIESQKAERDIGWTAAIHLWVEKYRPGWLPA
jgi:hypothetical protein